MSVQSLFVMDPLEGVDPHHDTTYAIMGEAESRGGKVWTCRSRDLIHHDDQLRARSRRVSVNGDFGGGNPHFEQTSRRREKPLADFDVVWMREDPPFDQRYLYATYLLDESPAPVINDPTGLRNANEKLLILAFPDLVPPTWVGADVDSALEFLATIEEGVAKSLEGFGGEQVHRVTADSSRDTLERMTDDGETAVMIQEFLPSVLSGGDRRLIVLGGEPIGGLTRHPEEGDFRANLHSGGSAEEVYVSDEEREICDQIAPVLRERGLHLVGLDLIDNRITEINVTSPTCVQEINRLSNQRLERDIQDYVEEVVLA